MNMRLKRIFDIVGCACVVGGVINAQFCEVSDWTVVLYLGTIVYGMSILYRAVKSTPCDSKDAHLFGLLNLLHRHHHDDG